MSEDIKIELDLGPAQRRIAPILAAIKSEDPTAEWEATDRAGHSVLLTKNNVGIAYFTIGVRPVSGDGIRCEAILKSVEFLYPFHH